jgi:hypothetical protein
MSAVRPLEAQLELLPGPIRLISDIYKGRKAVQNLHFHILEKLASH